jgi:expansin (peptidoglycan-binding protein)
MQKIKLLFVLITFCLGRIAQAQTAVNFSSYDCDNNYHDLFTELDQGKVVVLTWVMPCVGCIEGASMAGAYVQAVNSPNVVHYVADDYGNTACQSLSGWLFTNAIYYNACFKDSLISMEHYGISGMPKVIILSGLDHQVYYNANNTFVYSEFQAALNAAIQGARVAEVSQRKIQVFPNPANTEISLTLPDQKGRIQITDMEGRLVVDQQTKTMTERISISQLPVGLYSIQFVNDHVQFKTTFVVER